MRAVTITLLTTTALLSACATHMSERAAKIQVHNQMSTLLANCKNLGPVSVTAPFDEWTDSDAEARNLARDKAAEMGADTLVIVNREQFAEGSLLTRKIKAVVQGAALRCY
jgi:predicted xylose isomerase-like sugar epimerase